MIPAISQIAFRIVRKPQGRVSCQSFIVWALHSRLSFFWWELLLVAVAAVPAVQAEARAEAE